MIPYQRRILILEKLNQQEVVSIEEFTTILDGVSESTIRRDLKELESDGEIVFLRGGGATKTKPASDETPLISKNIINVEEKEKIAKYAASLVQDGEVIYIDSGTTPLKMIKYLKDKNITIVSTNALVFSEVENTNLRCVMIGGDIINSTGSIVGPLTDSTIQSLYFDRAFLGATGYDLDSGINTPDFREANKKKNVRNKSKKTYVLVDTSKEGKRTMCKALNLDECIIITEAETEFLKHNTNYIVAKD